MSKWITPKTNPTKKHQTKNFNNGLIQNCEYCSNQHFQIQPYHYHRNNNDLHWPYHTTSTSHLCGAPRDANSFTEIRASIETLDRLNQISRDELDLLHIIAAARIGDTKQSLEILRRFGSLSSTQLHDLFNDLEACSEMAYPRFREFVIELRKSSNAPRTRVSFLRSRTLSLILGALIILLTGTIVVSIEFVLPKSAAINSENILTSVSNADTALFLIPCHDLGEAPLGMRRFVLPTPLLIQAQTPPLCKNHFATYIPRCWPHINQVKQKYLRVACRLNR